MVEIPIEEFTFDHSSCIHFSIDECVNIDIGICFMYKIFSLEEILGAILRL